MRNQRHLKRTMETNTHHPRRHRTNRQNHKTRIPKPNQKLVQLSHRATRSHLHKHHRRRNTHTPTITTRHHRAQTRLQKNHLLIHHPMVTQHTTLGTMETNTHERTTRRNRKSTQILHRQQNTNDPRHKSPMARK